MADKLTSGIFITEILADNAGGSAVDVDGDGGANKADEFIELQNTSGSTISLDGYEIWSQKSGLLYAFDATATIGPSGTATVLGEYTGTPPAGFYDAGNSNSVNWLQDGEGQKFDSIFLVDTNTGEYVVLSYGQPPQAPVLPTGFPGTTQIGSGESLNSNAPNGTAFSRDGSGTFQEATPTPGSPDVPCFVAGTRIATARGLVKVDDLTPCDLIQTRDHAYVPLLAIATTHVTVRQQLTSPDLRPVEFAAGSVGNAGPLALSPQHRILVSDDRSQILFGCRETLIAARHFIGRSGVQLCDALSPITYVHLLFEQHEVIKAEGCWTESLFLGDVADRLIRDPQVWQVAEGVAISALHHSETARPILRQFEAQLLLRSRQALRKRAS